MDKTLDRELASIVAWLTLNDLNNWGKSDASREVQESQVVLRAKQEGIKLGSICPTLSSLGISLAIIPRAECSEPSFLHQDSRSLKNEEDAYTGQGQGNTRISHKAFFFFFFWALNMSSLEIENEQGCSGDSMGIGVWGEGRIARLE